MAAVQVAMIARMPYPALRAAIFTHPTAAEGLTALLAGAPVPPPRVTLRQEQAEPGRELACRVLPASARLTRGPTGIRRRSGNRR